MPIAGSEARFDWIASHFVFRNLFVLKIWYLIPDIAIALLIWRMLQYDLTRAKLGLLVWMFNPLVLYTAYFHGQFDLIPILFVVLGVFCAQKKKSVWAAFWIGIGACYKNFPFVFLIPLALILAQTLQDRLKLILVGVLPYLVFYMPSLKSYAGIGAHFSDNFFRAGYDLGFGNQVYFFFLVYVILLWILYLNQATTFEDFWRTCFSILLVYYQFSYFDLHYWIWIVPFALIYLVEQPREAAHFYAVIGLFLFLLLAPTPFIRFFAPISPHFFLRIPSLMEAVNMYLPMLFIDNVVRSFLAGTCFYLAYKLMREMPALSVKPSHPQEVHP
jgi:Gpi18-like mannosyltransferase